MKILITGGLGFIGINTALRFSDKFYGYDFNQVVIFDNLDKNGSLKNFDLVKDRDNVEFVKGDLRSRNDIERVITAHRFNVVFHFAGQTAVTKSVADPKLDFEHNVVGTFNLLEALRKYNPDSKLIYSCTNKVYGALENRKLKEKKTRYEFSSRIKGINEDEPLDFHSPYGCSKGAADQYIRDYSRLYNMKTIVARQSCIYGQYQNGTEDQGWVAWFVRAFLDKRPIRIYGDGKQVRDILYINDLVDFYELVANHHDASGIYNMGGGKSNTISLLELIDILEKKIGKVTIAFDEERPGDQKIFISDNTKAEKLGWKPRIDIEEGVDKLIAYMKGIK